MSTPSHGDNHETVSVDLGDRSYDILIGDGLLARAGDRIAALFPNARAVIVTDENVEAAHGAALAASLNAAQIDHSSIVVTPGEKSKSFATNTFIRAP